MGKINKPRHGSMAFWPRKRAGKQTPRIKFWPKVKEVTPLSIAGYKAGMTHILMVDDSDSPTKNLEVAVPVTVLEVPPVTVYGVRAYRKAYGGRQVSVDAYDGDEKLLKKLGVKKNGGIEKIKASADVVDVCLLVAANAGKTGFGKKSEDKMEVGVGGSDVKAKLDYCAGVLGKELKAGDVFKEGEFVDACSVTRGKGWQGAVKRFGVNMQRRKASGKRRHVGTLGPWHPAKVMYTVPMAGQMGYHVRTEINKRVMKIGENPAEINAKGGFPGYGLVKNPYIIVKGSVGGPVKRIVRLRKAARRTNEGKKPQINYVSLESKQG
ncbi:50S ribosomal protein L3 [Candidatus Micrarchaeota archaeon]|nr:50S ribosomal protein L3 [Candidatus Micrarchaeota archaeon]